MHLLSRLHDALTYMSVSRYNAPGQTVGVRPRDRDLGDRAHAALERLVRDKVRARFGGRLKALVSGGAPLNYEVGIFFSALGLRLLQSYNFV